MELFHQLIDLLLIMSAKLGYWGIIFLMTIESSFIPFPSEIVIPPAAYLASIGQMNLYLIIICGVIGSLLGALINYYLALTLGRKVIYYLADLKISNIFLINAEKIKKAEEYFLQYGKFSTFFGRLVPAIRQLISIPAGFSKMNIRHFVFYTVLGSASWVTILALLGYFLGAKQKLLSDLYHDLKYILIGLFLLFTTLIILKIKKQNSKTGDIKNIKN